MGMGVELLIGAHLIGRLAAVETQVLEGQHIEIGLLFGTDFDQVGEDEFVAGGGIAQAGKLTHGNGDVHGRRLVAEAAAAVVC